jgi:hypothetical protein
MSGLDPHEREDMDDEFHSPTPAMPGEEEAKVRTNCRTVKI